MKNSTIHFNPDSGNYKPRLPLALNDSSTELPNIPLPEKFTAMDKMTQQKKNGQPDEKFYKKESESILERITDGFLALDTAFRIIYINKAAEDMIGVNRKDLLNRDIKSMDYISENFFYQCDKAIKEQVKVSFEGHYAPLDLWSEVNVYPSETGLSIFFKNISEKKLADEAVKRLSLVATRTNNSVMLLSAEGRITWVNQAFCKSSGYSPDDVYGKIPSEIFHGPDTNKQTQRFIHSQFVEGNGFHEEIICYKKNGEPFWANINCQPIYDNAGHLQEYFSITSDITERKRSEEELKRLSLIVRDATYPIILLNVNRQITWMNDAFIKFSGYSANEIFGKMPGELLKGPESDPATLSRLHKSWDNRETFQTQTVCYNKKRQKLRAEITSQPLYADNGHFQQYFITLKDITESTRLQEELNRQQKEKQRQITMAVTRAQELERCRVSNELHDNVNQVLTTVKLYTELCRDGAENNKQLMERSVDLLQSCINDIRNLSKRLSGPAIDEISLSESLKDLVQSILETKKLKIKLYSINIDQFSPGQELHLAIYRILQEHLTNILKHASANTVVIRIQRTKRFISVTVADDGKGFDVHAPRTGVGLTNMKTRAVNLNGSLAITSSPGHGCKLAAKFPLLPE